MSYTYFLEKGKGNLIEPFCKLYLWRSIQAEAFREKNIFFVQNTNRKKNLQSYLVNALREGTEFVIFTRWPFLSDMYMKTINFSR